MATRIPTLLAIPFVMASAADTVIPAASNPVTTSPVGPYVLARLVLANPTVSLPLTVALRDGKAVSAYMESWEL
ncbi:hypothetical protein LBMAG53_31590 [Planctomycetota bacterium]|nr:hypothetical protein LBMAG53_31590 [Planctomycetota bacterium]